MPSLHLDFGSPNICRDLIDAIVDGRYGMMFSRDRETRLLRVAEISSLYTRQELLRERGFNPSKVAAIQRWLASQHRRFRDRREPLDVAICRLDIGSYRAAHSQGGSGKPASQQRRQFLGANSLA